MLRQLVADVLLVTGALFFFAGAIGLVRFPDLYTRLHAITKADNVGLGLIATGAALEMADPAVALKLAIIWLLVLASSALSSQLIARTGLERGDTPRRHR
jgi:multicomponent Na+:H+ antiporter subunit G